MAAPAALTEKTIPLYQKDQSITQHATTISGLSPLASLPDETRALFKPPPASEESLSEPYILTAPETIFYAQGGGQPSDTGVITLKSHESDSNTSFQIHQVRKIDPAILHLVTISPPPPPTPSFPSNAPIHQAIDVPTRTLHSKIHTAGHVIGLAINLLQRSPPDLGNPLLPPDLRDGKASHYPGAAFVESIGLIPGTAKSVIQAKVDELVAMDLPVGIYFWTEQEAAKRCIGGAEAMEGIKGDENGVRVVEIGDPKERGLHEGTCGSYPCGGTHVKTLKELGRVVVRGIKRQKGISKVSYEVSDS